MRKRFFILCFCLAAIVFYLFASVSRAIAERGVKITSAVNTERRIALVIGNSAYKSSPLRNPVNDATDMAAKLRSLGFQVSLGKNWSRKEMRTAIRSFGDELKRGGVGLFYYAGHGMQTEGKNYLIPVSSNIEREDEIQDEAIDAGSVLRKMESAGNTMNMVFLDACRNNPYARSFRSTSKGLAQMDAPSGSLIVYATAPGSVAADGPGRNGIFTKNLLAYLEIPGLPVNQLLMSVRKDVRLETDGKQIPWESSSLEGNFYFMPGTKTASVSSPDISTSSLESERLKLQEERRRMELEAERNRLELDKERQNIEMKRERQRLAKERRELEKEKEQMKMASLPHDKGKALGETRSSDGRYIDHGDGTITDNNTGLMWTKKDSYADTGSCMNWSDSRNYVSNLSTGRYSDWRLPTVQELKSIFEKSKFNKDYSGGTIHSDPIFASGGAYQNWSSEEDGSLWSVRVVDFKYGDVSKYGRVFCSYAGVRAVRPLFSNKESTENLLQLNRSLVDCTAQESGSYCQGCVDVGNNNSVCKSVSGDCGSCSLNACLHSPKYAATFDRKCP